ncbi:MAG: ribonuclease H-like domain-containing protein [Bacteroidota bacterium]
MLSHINIRDLIFIDIETVPQFSSHEQLSKPMKELWAAKHSFLKTANETSEDGYLKRAGVYAEFAKIICVSIGYFRLDKETKESTFRVKSFYGDDEKLLLEEFVTLLNKNFSSDRFHFCGHNIREFDIPFICRRLLINHLKFPELLDVSGKRPWEMFDVDTLQLWKFGDYKHYTSLKLLAEVLGIPTPKGDIEGKDVCRVYWQEDGLSRIVEYCQKDVITVARLLLRFKGDSQLLSESDIIFVK